MWWVGQLGNLFSNLDEFTLFGLSLVLIAITGVAFGIVWIVVNFYHLYPYVQFYAIPRLTRADMRDDVYVSQKDISDIAVDDLPTIDVLLPAYKEGNVISQSISSIRQANYPQELVNINILTEPEDDQTREALEQLSDRYEFQEITIPPEYNEIVVPNKYPGAPNKPRALNYGFELTDGDIVGVIDAEDIIDPDLFIHVYNGLIREEHDYVQGILDMVNENDGWMNTIFRSEYAWWFQWLLPAFHYSGYPVPLGGTTNFFHREVLNEISERRYKEYGSPWSENQMAWFDQHSLDGAMPWDPRNVTEDFELGLFLWKENYSLGLLDSVTREESPLSLSGWIQQRTRWQKGKVYSFIQYANNRPQGINAKFHLLLQSFLPHLAPINIAGIVILLMVANILGLGMPIGVALVLIVGFIFLIEMNIIHAVSYWRATSVSVSKRLLRATIVLLTLQIYWIPLWGAEQRALKQVYTNQLHWEKTTHHGRNAKQKNITDTSPTPYTKKEVIIGLLVLIMGLFIGFILPILWIS